MTATYSSAGSTMPPIAAAIGSAARAGSRRSPATNSRFSSRPTTKKKIARSPSAAHCSSVRSRCAPAGPSWKSLSRRVRLRQRGIGQHKSQSGCGEQEGTTDRLPAQITAMRAVSDQVPCPSRTRADADLLNDTAPHPLAEGSAGRPYGRRYLGAAPTPSHQAARIAGGLRATASQQMNAAAHDALRTQTPQCCAPMYPGGAFSPA